MSEIEIPFNELMAKRSLYHRKVCTSRNKKYGEIGDTFYIEFENLHQNFRLFAIEKHLLGFVKQNLFYMEGFEHPELFELMWDHLHPRKKFDPDQKVWVHWYLPIIDYGVIR